MLFNRGSAEPQASAIACQGFRQNRPKLPGTKFATRSIQARRQDLTAAGITNHKGGTFLNTVLDVSSNRDQTLNGGTYFKWGRAPLVPRWRRPWFYTVVVLAITLVHSILATMNRIENCLSIAFTYSCLCVTSYALKRELGSLYRVPQARQSFV